MNNKYLRLLLRVELNKAPNLISHNVTYFCGIFSACFREQVRNGQGVSCKVYRNTVYSPVL